jgi:serine/threonine-protein kinase
MSSDPEQEYFCDGITEEIINALSHIESLKVIARTSAFMFKGKQEDIREIGKKLDVETLLEGSVRKAGNRLRITAQLIKVADRSHIWSDAYNRELKDVFAIQEEISLAIVENLKVKLLGKEKVAIEKRYTENLEAYNQYLQGCFYWQKLTSEGYEKAFCYFNKALQEDPNYSLSYLGIANIYVTSSIWGRLPPNENFPKAKELLNRTLEIDNTLSEAHSALGIIYLLHEWNFKEAEKELKLAQTLNPNSSEAHLYYSMYLSLTELHEEAIYQAKRAAVLDPLSIFITTMSNYSYWYAGHYDKAIEELKKTVSLNPYYHLAHQFLGDAYSAKSMFHEAINEFKMSVELSDNDPMAVANLACLYFETGETIKAEKLLNILKKRSEHEYILPMCFFMYHRIQGNLDQAYNWLKQACIDHDSRLVLWRIQPIERYRIPDEPRFIELMEQVGLGNFLI